MACEKGSVTTGIGKATVYVCTSTDSNNVNVTIEGSADKIDVYGYIRLHLEVLSTSGNAWVRASSKDAGLWDESKGKKNASLPSSHTSGTKMRVLAEFFNKSNYTERFGSAESPMFTR